MSLRAEPNEVRQEIRVAQLSAVFRQTPIALVVNAVNAIVTFLVLGQLIGLARPLAWVCIVLLVTSGRWGLWLGYRHARSGIELGAANLRLQAEIAEREATEAASRQAQKLEAVGQLAGGISHDFNNLLTVVIGNLLLAIERAGDIPAILPLLQNAHQAAERGVALIGCLLAFARKQRLDPRSVNLKCLIAGIEDLLHRTLGDRIRLVISADADLAPARVDANQLELAILNLTINARDAMPHGGNLLICLHNRLANYGWPSGLSPGKYVVVSISDTGTAWTRRRSRRPSSRSSPRRKSAVVQAAGCRWSKLLPLNPEAMCGSKAKSAREPRSSSGCPG